MNDKKDKKGISGVERAQKSSSIKQVESVDEVTRVTKTERVGKARGSSSVGGATQKLLYEDREKLLSLVDEEAEKLFEKSNLPEGQKKVIRDAVKMAIDGSLLDEEGIAVEGKAQDEKS